MSGHALLHAANLLDAADIMPGMHVADFGVGRSGHLVFPAAKKVGEDGRVYAVDLSQDALDMIEGRRRQYLVHNLDTVWGDVEHLGGVNIPERSLDVAFLVNMMWVLKNHLGAVREIQRLVRPEGKIVVVDWFPHTRHPVAPPTGLRLHPNASDVYFVSGGCDLHDEFRPSPWHWGKMYTVGRV